MSGLDYAARLQGAVKRFGRIHALSGVTIDLPAGLAIGLMGPNGSGKSTLLRLLAGLQRPTAGHVEVLGRRPGWETKAKIAYVPDGDFLYGFLTVEETAAYHATLFPDFDRGRAERLLTEAGLPLHNAVASLSRGQRTRLALILAYSRRARLYLLDEPLAHLDPRSRRLVADLLLAEYPGDDATVVMATHQVGEVERLFDYAIYLSQGSVVRAGSADALREETGLSLLALAEEVG